MGKERVSVNIDSIDKTVKQLMEKCEIIEKSIKETKEKLDDSKSYFDTPAGDHFRKRVDDIFDQEILKLKNDFIPSIEVLNKIVSLYQEEIEAEKKIISAAKGN